MKRKIIIMIVVCTVFNLVGCKSEKGHSMEKNTSEVTTEIVINVNENETDEIKPRYMVMLENKLYIDTGETNSQLRCGNMDFDLEYTGKLDKIPNKNGKANCKASGGQYSWRENRIEIYIDDAWHILAYNENNADGISMRVTENTNTTLTLEIINNTDRDIQYGKKFVLEKKDEETGEWCGVQTVIDDYAFEDIACIANSEKSSLENIDFEWLYGKLEEGTYRVVKELYDYGKNQDNTKYWYSAEFAVIEY